MEVYIVVDSIDPSIMKIFSSRQKAEIYLSKNNLSNRIIIVKTVDDNSDYDTDEADTNWQEEDKKYLNMKYNY